MKTYVKYLIRNLSLPFLSITVVLGLIILQLNSLRFIDLVVSNGLDLSGFIKLSLISMPSIISYIMPMAAFVSVCYVYNKLINDKEIIILQSSGLNHTKLMRPTLIFGIMVSLLTFINGFFVLPLATESLSKQTAELKNNYFSGFFQEGVFNHPAPNITIYVDKYSKDGSFLGVIIYDNRSEKPVTLIAKKATIHKFKNKAPFFNLVSGSRQQFNKNKNLEILYFDNFILDFEIYQKNETKHRKPTGAYFLWELLNPPAEIDETQRTLMKIEGIYSILWPLYAVTLALIASFMLISGSFKRQGQSHKIIKASLIAAFLILATILIKNFFTKTTWPISALIACLIMVNLGAFYACKWVNLKFHSK